MNNNENFKKAMDNIKADDELKNKTFQKITQKKKNNMVLFKVLSMCAVFAIVFGVGTMYYKNPEIIELAKSGTTNNKAEEQIELPRFENIDELKKVLSKSSNTRYLYTDVMYDAEMNESVKSADVRGVQTESASVDDYSKTNVQVDDVDEADIVKTDGKNIYFVKENMVYVVSAEDLKIIGKIAFDKDDNDFVPKEIYIKDSKLVVLGISYIFDDEADEADEADDYDYDSYSYYSYYNNKTLTEVVVMDISDISKPKEERRVSLDGTYSNSRMIGDNIYFISNRYVYYYDDMKDKDLLPEYRDSVKGNKYVSIPAEDIAYFGGTRNYSYMIVAGFNINDKEEASIETIFGASDTVYSSTDNLYVVQEKYTTSGTTKSIIYRFEYDGPKITLKAKGKVKGYLNNQFSMDEYEGNLRVATTSNVGGINKNQVYVLDKDLVQIGAVRNMAIDEKIYSVRFIGKVGYVVTFKQIDPLFVIDLSDPTNPEIKGELKIPGYSSYLHPYDENHIIGIGYNTKENEWGGTINQGLKMSMFDISDLENPKEVFNIDIGDQFTNSEITSNHKALFYNKDKNLIGFPIKYRSSDYKETNSGFTIFKIDLEKGFEKYGDILEAKGWTERPQRAIYIKDMLYTVYTNNIFSYDLNTLKNVSSIELK